MTGSFDKTVRVWQISVGENVFSCLRVLEGHTGSVYCLQLDGNIAGEVREEAGRQRGIADGPAVRALVTVEAVGQRGAVRADLDAEGAA